MPFVVSDVLPRIRPGAGIGFLFFFVFALLEIDNNFFTSKLVSVGE